MYYLFIDLTDGYFWAFRISEREAISQTFTPLRIFTIHVLFEPMRMVFLLNLLGDMRGFVPNPNVSLLLFPELCFLGDLRFFGEAFL